MWCYQLDSAYGPDESHVQETWATMNLILEASKTPYATYNYQEQGWKKAAKVTIICSTEKSNPVMCFHILIALLNYTTLLCNLGKVSSIL